MSQTEQTFLHQWLDTATDQEVMLFVAEMGRVSPQCVKCFRLLAMVLVGAKKVDRKHLYDDVKPIATEQTSAPPPAP